MAPTIYYVSDLSGNDTNGNDTKTNDNIKNPFKTIQAAANVAKPGDTILVYPGIYRERVSPPIGGSSPTLPIIYKSIVPQGAIIRGSVPWVPISSYPKKSSVVYISPLLSTDFTDTSAIDGPNPFKIPVSVTPFCKNGAPEAANKDPNSDPYMIYTLGQVFVNDEMYTQCPYRLEMETTDKSWFYDITANHLLVHIPNSILNPKIEITNQRRLFAPHIRGLKNIIVDGFIIERCGNNYPNKFWSIPQNQQAGAIGTRCGRFWTIQNNVIRYANGVGIDWGNEGNADQDLEFPQNLNTNGSATGSNGHVIQNNIISDNGAAGTASYMGKNFQFSGNTVERNNNLKFFGKRRWESAGLKVHCPTNSLIINNLIRNNYCHGIWCDQGAGLSSTFKNNIIVGNQQSGINFEIGVKTSGKVINNIFDANEYGVSFATSGGVLIAHNLFISSIIADIYTNIFLRTADKWDSLNVEIYYNMFMNSPQYMQLTQPVEGIASRYMNYNQYFLANDKSFQLISLDGKTKTSMSLVEWQKKWMTFTVKNAADEDSIALQSIMQCELLETDKGKYKVDIKVPFEKTFPTEFPYITIPDITDDYFMIDWNTNTCCAGPFSELLKGVKGPELTKTSFVLNKAFVL